MTQRTYDRLYVAVICLIAAGLAAGPWKALVFVVMWLIAALFMGDLLTAVRHQRKEPAE